MAQTTDQILTHHLEAFLARDMSAILEDYTPSSLIITPDGTVLRGPRQIRGLFEAMFAEFAKPTSSFALGTRVVEGETAYITWTAETADNVYELGTDTFQVRDGKITIQTFAAKARPKR